MHRLDCIVFCLVFVCNFQANALVNTLGSQVTIFGRAALSRVVPTFGHAAKREVYTRLDNTARVDNWKIPTNSLTLCLAGTS